MNRKELISKSDQSTPSNRETDKVQSLQDKTGATAAQIRRAIELVGFDRDKVEQHLLTSGT